MRGASHRTHQAGLGGLETHFELRAYETDASDFVAVVDDLDGNPRMRQLTHPIDDAKVAPNLVDKGTFERQLTLGIESRGRPAGQVFILEQVENTTHAELGDASPALAQASAHLGVQGGAIQELRQLSELVQFLYCNPLKSQMDHNARQIHFPELILYRYMITLF